jgi:hypothetical protein
MSVHKKIVSLAFATTLAGAGLIGSASTAGAASCYGSAHSYNKPANSSFLPNIVYGHLKSTSNCADINIKPNAPRYVRVCFVPSNGDTYCQDGYTLAPADEWTEIATDVEDGTKFAFHFQGRRSINGVLGSVRPGRAARGLAVSAVWYGGFLRWMGRGRCRGCTCGSRRSWRVCRSGRCGGGWPMDAGAMSGRGPGRTGFR